MYKKKIPLYWAARKTTNLNKVSRFYTNWNEDWKKLYWEADEQVLCKLWKLFYY